MADINIQRKKGSPSPWLLVLLAAIVLGLAAYFFLRPDAPDEPTSPAATPEAAPATAPDTVAAAAAVDQATRRAAIDAIPQGDTTAAGSQETAESLAAQAASDPATPAYARNGLQKLTGVLVALADRDDLRDATITEQRDNLTSATDRVGEPGASLRPGFVAAANLVRAMQQKAYPNLENQANELTRLAGQLSGRSATAADQQQNKQFLTKAAEAVRVLSEPAPGSLN